MNNEVKNLIALGLGVAGVIAAASSFSSQLDTVQKKGLTLSSGIVLISVGLIFFYRLENTADQAKRLLS